MGTNNLDLEQLSVWYLECIKDHGFSKMMIQRSGNINNWIANERFSCTNSAHSTCHWIDRNKQLVSQKLSVRWDLKLKYWINSQFPMHKLNYTQWAHKVFPSNMALGRFWRSFQKNRDCQFHHYSILWESLVIIEALWFYFDMLTLNNFTLSVTCFMFNK